MRLNICIAAALCCAAGAAPAVDTRRAVADDQRFDPGSVFEPSLSVEAEYRHFPHEANHESQQGDYASLAATAGLEADWDNRDQAFTLTLFGRTDRFDARRSHVDVREAFYRYTTREFAWRMGVRKIFWGVTESVHLVDIINQTDFVEDIDGEAKLGQPMINLALFTDLGTVNFFVLPIFREQTFPAKDGRPRPLLPVATERARFPDDEGVDLAVRYFESFGAWDIGLSLFHGTSREPRFDFGFDTCTVTATFEPGLIINPPPQSVSCAEAQSTSVPPAVTVDDVRVTVDEPVFVPLYEDIDQVGLDLQHVRGALALKLEAIYRESDTESFTAAAGGFEYTLYQLFGSQASLGLLAEYLYDSRDQLDADIARAGAALAESDSLTFESVDAARAFQAGLRTQSAAAFQNDLFAGLRLALNDLAGTEILAGAIRDLDTGAITGSIEASRRLGGSNRVGLNLRLFSDIPVTDPQFSFRDDDYLEVTLTHFF